MKKKKRHLTLIEMMVVILLIGLVAGVLAYNFRGSLDQGKAFKTKEGIARLENLLTWELASGHSAQEVERNWQNIVAQSPLGGRTEDLVRDGWGNFYRVNVDGEGEVTVSSRAYEEWLSRQAR